MHTILEEQVEKMWEVRKANPRNYDWIVSFLRASNIAVAKAVIKEVKETLQQTSRQALDFTDEHDSVLTLPLIYSALQEIEHSLIKNQRKMNEETPKQNLAKLGVVAFLMWMGVMAGWYFHPDTKEVDVCPTDAKEKLLYSRPWA